MHEAVEPLALQVHTVGIEKPGTLWYIQTLGYYYSAPERNELPSHETRGGILHIAKWKRPIWNMYDVKLQLYNIPEKVKLLRQEDQPEVWKNE